MMFEKTYLHKKTGGYYKLLYYGTDEHTMETVVIYQSLKTGKIWVRPASEFHDGRFKEVRGN